MLHKTAASTERRSRRARTRLVLHGLLACAGCAPVPRGASTVIVASGADLESANPLTTVHPLARQVQRYALFVTLARYDSVLDPVPYFARAWSWSPDGRHLRLVLASGLRWHDGGPTTARDVAFTIDAARDPATGFYRRGDLVDVDSVSVLDDTTLTVAFARPQPPFPLVFCELPIAPAHLLDSVPRARLRAHPFARAPVGNGPYRFVERRPGQSWSFVADSTFPAALGGPPHIERLVIAVVEEPTTKFAGLASGDVDLAGISPGMAGLTAADPQLEVVSYPVAFTSVLVFNTEREPFRDARVRRAIAAAIDRGRIVNVALNGFGEPASGAIPPGHPFQGAAGLREDPDSLLDAAGFPRQSSGFRSRSGRSLRFTLRTVGSGDNALEQLLQADLRARGIRVDIEQMELGAFLTQARADVKTFDALVTGIPGDVSLSHVAAMFEGSQAGGALDYAGFHRPALDSLLREARSAASDAARAEAWRRVDAWLAREAPVAWLYHARGVQGKRRGLQGVRMDLRGELVTLTSWTLDASLP